MPYHHRQTGKLHWIVLLPVVLILAWLLRTNLAAMLLPLALAWILAFIAFCFQYLTVRDAGDHLALRYGPIPLFRKRFPYRHMTAAEPTRSSLIDGWGIHYTPGRGWIYNLWGFDCVQVQLGKKTVRIGTDDAAGLAAFLKTKISPDHANPPTPNAPANP